MKLFSGPASLFGSKVEIALREKGLPFELELVPFSMATGYSPIHPEVIRVNPFKRQIPVLLDPPVEIYDSTQIFEYLDDLQSGISLWPADTAGRARARRLELECDEVFFPLLVRRMKKPQSQEDKDRSRAAKESVMHHYGMLDAGLADQDFLAGGFSYADISFFLAMVFAERLGCPVPEHCLHLRAWRDRVAQRPAVGLVATRVAGTLDARP